MDALSRREFWLLIKKLTPNRVIALTTHYMEEADVLGKKITQISQKNSPLNISA